MSEIEYTHWSLLQRYKIAARKCATAEVEHYRKKLEQDDKTRIHDMVDASLIVTNAQATLLAIQEQLEAAGIELPDVEITEQEVSSV